MAQLEYTTIEALEDLILGAKGTPRRDAFETAVKEEIQTYLTKETIKTVLKKQNLSQDQSAFEI